VHLGLPQHFLAKLENVRKGKKQTIRRSDSSESLLARCIPLEKHATAYKYWNAKKTHNLQLYSLSLELDCTNLEIDANGGYIGFCISVVRKSQQKARFANARIFSAYPRSASASLGAEPCQTYRLFSKKMLSDILHSQNYKGCSPTV